MKRNVRKKITFAEQTPLDEKMPRFNGDLNKWLRKNLRYPVRCAEMGIGGKVFVEFVVEKDGSISSINVERSADPDLSQEAIRVVKAMPKCAFFDNRLGLTLDYFQKKTTGMLIHEKSCADLNALSAEHKCCGNLSAVCNTACGNYRYIYCVNNLRNKSHCCEITDMTA